MLGRVVRVRPPPPLMPKQEIHLARREYRCGQGHCTRRIGAGRPYTQVSYAPGERPYSASSTWTYVKACAVCIPLAIIEEELPAPTACTAAAGDLQCQLSAGHHPATDHEFLEGLF